MNYYENICNCLRVIQQDLNRKLKSANCWQRTSLSYFIPRLHRSAYAKFRCGVAPIRLETGRYERIPLESRTCFVCLDSVESEEHVLLKCPPYNNLREALFTFLINEFPDIYGVNDRERLCAILSCNQPRSIRACARTYSDILKLRRNTLYS